MPQSSIRRYLRHGILPQLAVFDAAARLGSFTRAAEALHLAQPTVSSQIRKLTDTVGLPLFEQVGRRIHLTSAGAKLQEGCAELFDAFDRIESSLAGLRGLELGRLRVAVGAAAAQLAPRLLAGFAHRYPGIEVSLEVCNRQGLLERLQRNADDLCLFSDPPEGADLVREPLLANPLVACAHAGHRLAGRGQVAFAEFAREPFLLREPGSGTRRTTLAAFARRGLQPLVRMELSTNEAVKQAILAGLGVSILSRHALGAEAARGGLVELEVEGLPIEKFWQLVHPAGKQVSPAARAFIDYARAEAKGVATAVEPSSSQ